MTNSSLICWFTLAINFWASVVRGHTCTNSFAPSAHFLLTKADVLASKMKFSASHYVWKIGFPKKSKFFHTNNHILCTVVSY